MVSNSIRWVSFMSALERRLFQSVCMPFQEVPAALGLWYYISDSSHDGIPPANGALGRSACLTECRKSPVVTFRCSVSASVSPARPRQRFCSPEKMRHELHACHA